MIRTFHIGVYHEAQISDAITIHNNGSAPIGGIDWFLPGTLEPNILEFEAEDLNGKLLPMSLVEINNGMLYWKIHFFEPIDFRGEYSLTVRMHMHSLHQNVEGTIGKFNITYPRHPIVPYVLSTSELKITSEPGDSIFGASPEGIKNNVEPMSTDEFSYVLTSNKPEVVGDRVTKITMDPWGWLSVKETVSIENIGTATDNLIRFKVPAFSTAITIYDEVGILARSQETTEHDFNKSVNLVIELSSDRFGALGFQIGDRYTFQIDYVVQIEGHQELTTEGNKLKI